MAFLYLTNTKPLESKPFLSGKHSVNPALFFRGSRIKGGERLSKRPEARVAADTVFHKKTFQRFAAAGGEKDHALMDAIEDCVSNATDLRLAECCFGVAGLLQHLKQ